MATSVRLPQAIQDFSRSLDRCVPGPVAWSGSGGDFHYQRTGTPFKALADLALSSVSQYEMLARSLGWYAARRAEGLRQPLTVVLELVPNAETLELLQDAARRNLNLLVIRLDLGRPEATTGWNPLRRETKDSRPEQLCRQTGMRLAGQFDTRKPDRLERALEEEIQDGATRLVVVHGEAESPSSPAPSRAAAAPSAGWSNQLLVDNVLERFGEELAQSQQEIVFWARKSPPHWMQQLGDRLVNCSLRGVVEQAVGASMAGLYPVLIVPASGLPELMPSLLEYGSFSATIVVAEGGLTPSKDDRGEAYYHPAATRDLAFLRTLPGTVIACPADEEEAASLLGVARRHPGTVILRFTSAPSVGISGGSVEIGRGRRLRRGRDAAILAIGSTVFPAVLAAESMRAWGVEVAVYDMRFAMPLDIDLLREATRCKTLVTVEEHTITGGFGASVLETLGQQEFDPVRVRCLGIGEGEHEVATAAPLEPFHLHAEGIADTVRQVLGLKAPGEF